MISAAVHSEALALPAALAKVFRAMAAGAPAVRCPCCRSDAKAELGHQDGVALWLYRCPCGAIFDAARVVPT